MRGTSKLGLVFLTAIALVIAAIVVDELALRQNRGRRGQMSCANHLRQVGQAVYFCAQDNHGPFPPDLQTVKATQQVSFDCFVCDDTTDTPAATLESLSTGGHCSYIYVGASLTKDAAPQCIVALEDPANHKLEGGNVLFGDGHVEFLDLPAIQLILNELNSGRNPPATLTPTLSRAGAEQDYQKNWKSRMPQLKTGAWRIPTTQPAKPE